MEGERSCPTCGGGVSGAYRLCPHCATTIADPDRDALDMLRGRIVALDTQMWQLIAERQSLVEEYERHRFAIVNRAQVPVPPAAAIPGAAPPERPEWSGARVRALLLGVGAALLGISALTFTAVAWSRLGDVGRMVLLLASTALITGLALALRRRLPMTAEAFAGLAILLVLVDVYAVRQAGIAPGMSWQVWWAAGTAAAAGFAAALGRVVGRRTTRFAVAALLPFSPELLAYRLADTEWLAAMLLAGVASAVVYALIRWSGHLRWESRVMLVWHAAVCWMAAAFLAGLAADQPVTVLSAVPPALAVAALAIAPALALRRLVVPGQRVGAAALTAGVPAGVVLTLVAPLVGVDGLLTTAVVAGVVTVLLASLLAGAQRIGGLIAGAAYAGPGTLLALAAGATAATGPLSWLAEPWGGTVHSTATVASLSGSWAAVGCLAAIGALGIALGLRQRRYFVIAGVATGLIAALMPLASGASILVMLVTTTGTSLMMLLAAARADRAQPSVAWALLSGAAVAAVPTAGWAAVSVGASVVTLALCTTAAGAAGVIARTPAVRALCAAVAALLAVTFVGVVTKAAGTQGATAGFAAAITAGCVVLFSVYLLRGQPAVATAVESAAAIGAAAGVLIAADDASWLAGALTALVPVAALASLRPRRRILYCVTAGTLALAATWAWLVAAQVTVVEAYTAPAALAALAAGIAGWRKSPGRSWLTLGPALVLAIGPTLVLGMADDDVLRLIVAAALSSAVMIGGGVWRLQAPLCIGAASLVVLAVDQWGDEIVRMPRWISIGAAGLLLMWIGATFEHRRRDWHRASDLVSRFG